MKNEGGYTLIEILAGVFILGIVLTVFFQFFIFSQKTTTDNKEQLVALKLAETVLEQMISDKSIYRDKLVDIEGVLTYEFNYDEPYDEYKVKITVGDEQKITVDGEQRGLGVYHVTVSVFGKNNQELSKVKGLVEL